MCLLTVFQREMSLNRICRKCKLFNVAAFILIKITDCYLRSITIASQDKSLTLISAESEFSEVYVGEISVFVHFMSLAQHCFSPKNRNVD